jgi:hypothetical protein
VSCHDLIHLTQKEHVANHEGFEKWSDIEQDGLNLEYYIDKNLLHQIGQSNVNMIIDVKSWKILRKQKHSLVLKIEA